MNILVVGGTRFVGKHLVDTLLSKGHKVTIATRGRTADDLGSKVNRIIIERTDPESLVRALGKTFFDIIFDSLAYCSNDVKYLLDIAKCDKYIMTSSTAVYEKHIDTREKEFDPLNKKLIWCGRTDYPYDEIKRQAECALWQEYSHVNAVAVRFPFIIGKDDYTKRLFFYIEHIVKGIPVFVDNYDNQISFVRSDEAGKFLASFIDNNFCGPINGSSEQTISIHDIVDYVKLKTGKSLLLTSNGDKAPYNGESEYSINIARAKKLGFRFTPLHEWIYDLIDFYIQQADM